MTEGCWYHLLITCTVASHERVSGEPDIWRQTAEVLSTGICDSISKHCWQDGCPSKWLQKRHCKSDLTSTLLENRRIAKEGVANGIVDAEVILSLKFLDHADHCSTTFQHLKYATQMKCPDLSFYIDRTHPISQYYSTPTWMTCPSTPRRTQWT